MEIAQSEIFFLSPDTLDDVSYYRTAKGIKASDLINEAVTIGTSLIDMVRTKHTFILDGRPYRLPEVGKSSPPPSPWSVNIFPTQLRRIDYIASYLHVDAGKALEWCIACWSAVDSINHHRQALACVSPDGVISPAQEIGK